MWYLEPLCISGTPETFFLPDSHLKTIVCHSDLMIGLIVVVVVAAAEKKGYQTNYYFSTNSS